MVPLSSSTQVEDPSVHDKSSVVIPPAAVLIDRAFSISHPADHELDELQWGNRLSGPSPLPDNQNCHQSDSSSRARSVSEMEQNRTRGADEDAPPDQFAADLVPTAAHPYMNRWRIAACCLTFFTTGSNDGATGALLPYIQSDYNIGYLVASFIFVANALGFIGAAPTVHAIEARFGAAKSRMIAMTLMIIGYVMIVSTPPFAVVVVAFLPLGFGMAMTLALNNVFIVNLANGTVYLGFMHGFYGLGGIVAPLIATGMVSRGVPWSRFYLFSLSISIIGFFTLGGTFWNLEKETIQSRHSSPGERSTPSGHPGQEQPPAAPPSKLALLQLALRHKSTLLGALFIFAYQGAEVSISGWVISFLIHQRHGNPTHVGYVTAGFWAGITVGRFLLVRPSQRYLPGGARSAVLLLNIFSAVFQLIFWLAPAVIADAVAVSIVGLLQGPVYPLATGEFSKLLPRDIQMSGLGFIASMGSSGGAVAPFFTGALSQHLGTFVLNPICLGLFAIMEVAWLLLPRLEKRRV